MTYSFCTAFRRVPNALFIIVYEDQTRPGQLLEIPATLLSELTQAVFVVKETRCSSL